MKQKKVASLLLLGLLSTAFTAISANAACTAITALPKTISSAGTYCLTGDLSASTASSATGPNTGAITISADNVVLDLAGFEIKNTNTNATTNFHTFGVYETGTHSNITVKNGRINGYYGGLFFEDKGTGTTSNCLVDGINVYNFGWDGIRVDGSSTIIRNNRVYAITPSADGTYGIVATGPNTSVINNDIGGMITWEGFKFHAYGDDNLVENNRISTTASKTGNSTGILISSGTTGTGSTIIVNNRIRNFDTGIDFNNATGPYRDNLFLNNGTNVLNDTNATNAGNNQ